MHEYLDIFRFEDVPTDGDCFYYCLARFIGKRNLNAKKLRQMVVSYVHANEDMMQHIFHLLNMTEHTFESYLSYMSKQYKWVGLFDIHAAACALDLHIVVVSMCKFESAPKPEYISTMDVIQKHTGFTPLVTQKVFLLHHRAGKYQKYYTYAKLNHYGCLIPIDRSIDHFCIIQSRFAQNASHLEKKDAIVVSDDEAKENENIVCNTVCKEASSNSKISDSHTDDSDADTDSDTSDVSSDVDGSDTNNSDTDTFSSFSSCLETSSCESDDLEEKEGDKPDQEGDKPDKEAGNTREDPHKTQKINACADHSDHLLLHMTFTDASTVKLHMNELANQTGYQTRVNISNNRTKTYVCKDNTTNCPFYVAFNRRRNENHFVLTSVTPEHNHGPHVFEKRSKQTEISYKWVASHIESDILYNPSISCQSIITKMKINRGVDVNYKTAYRAKKYILQGQQKGNPYATLAAYISKMQELGEPCSIDIHRGRFVRCFVAFKAVTAAFERCVPAVVIDATHLKNIFKGMLLAAVTKDPNGQMVLLAYAIVPAEDADNWKYFLNQLKSCHTSFAERSFLIMSDRDKGISSAIEYALPHCIQVNCLKHMARNMRSALKVKENVIWKASTCKTKKEYDEFVASLTPEVQNYFKKLDPRNFADFALTLPRFGFYTSNLAESFNSLIEQARSDPVSKLAERIHVYWMTAWFDRSKGKFQELAQTKVLQSIPEARKLQVFMSSEHSGLVVDGKFQFIVHLNKKFCECLEFQHNGIPCIHAIAVCLVCKKEPEKYIRSVLKAKSFAKLYRGSIPPINFSELPADGTVMPPKTKKQRGRPKKRRIRSKGEDPSCKRVRRAGAIQKCTRCNQSGHNQRTCKQPI
jgi:zinc finger SWIM domain-containing protein 3